MMGRQSAIPMKNTSAWVYRDVRLQRHSASTQMRTGVHAWTHAAAAPFRPVQQGAQRSPACNACSHSLLAMHAATRSLHNKE